MFVLSILLVVLAVYSVLITGILIYDRNKQQTQQDTLVSNNALSNNIEPNTRVKSDNQPELHIGEIPITGNDIESDLEKRYLLKADEAMHLSTTFQKFVPKQFVEHFAKQGNHDIKLGAADEDSVAILFCDIRGFTSLSERMSPQELMNFLNSYFLRMNAPIHTNFGFIDKFIGDAIMALFDRPDGQDQDKAIDAIRASIGLRKALTLYNEHRSKSGYLPIDTGIGIHFGPVILGTVGSDDRMDTTVIGDSVNIAQRLESLAPKYKIDIIASETLMKTALSDKNVKEELKYREIDFVRVRGRSEPIILVEILNHLPETQIRQRKASEALIQKVIHLRANFQFELAQQLLEEQNIVDDPIIEHHIKSLASLKTNLPTPDWDGALNV